MPESTAAVELCKLALIILLLPLGAFIIQIFFSKKLPREGDWVSTVAMFVGLCMSLKMLFVDLFSTPTGITVQKWFPAQDSIGKFLLIGDPANPAFRLDFGIQVDNLTIVMLVVVTLVSFLVHLYSMGYMHGEVRYNRFFAFLALFTFSMLGLCITSNILFLFIFWELVGLCSYFLIGFYFEKKSASNASIKAFMTTRIGDLGFFVAILIMAYNAGSLEFDKIFESIANGTWKDKSILALGGICLFIGPIGKSGQFPLHVWLPDAMEGPTPVSALIHAATMVAAGVYMVGRMFPFFVGEGYVTGDWWGSEPLIFVAWIGGFTAIFAASIAFVQTDIKKVLAYSTVSQLGYMMLAIGCGGVAAGLFHLTTHAMFKALLFLGSGSVIHAVHSNEMSKMGGLWKKMKITWLTMGIATFAIAGLPFVLSGFYSKEAVLTTAWAAAKMNPGAYTIPFWMGMVTALMTAFYMFRMFFKTFHGEPKDKKAFDHAHESPWTMTVPLGVLALLTVLCGGFKFINKSDYWFLNRMDSEILAPYTHPASVNATPVVDDPEKHVHPLPFTDGRVHMQSQKQKEFREAYGLGHGTVTYLSMGAFLFGLLGAWFFFGPNSPGSKKDMLAPEAPLGKALKPLNHCLVNLWFVDAFYYAFFLKALHVIKDISYRFDKYVVDGIVNLQGVLCKAISSLVGIVDYEGVDGTVRGIGKTTLSIGKFAKIFQTGKLQQYLYASVFLAVGAIGLTVAIYLWVG